MQLTTASLAAVKSTGLLPVFAYALLAALGLGAAGGGWVGWRMARGAAAIEQNARLRGEIDVLMDAAEDIRQGAADSQLAFKAAADRMDGIANHREQDRERNRLQFEQQSKSLQDLLDARPDLRDLRLGDDVLRHWRESNTRPGAEPAAPAATGEPQAAVPGPAATSGRSRTDVVGQPRPGGPPVPRMPERQWPLDRSGQRIPGHGLAVVLRGGRPPGHPGRRLWT